MPSMLGMRRLVAAAVAIGVVAVAGGSARSSPLMAAWPAIHVPARAAGQMETELRRYEVSARPTSVVPYGDGVVASIERGTRQGFDADVIHYDGSGTKVFHATFDRYPIEALTDVAVTADGNVVAAGLGKGVVDGVSRQRVWAVALTATGDIVWERHVDVPPFAGPEVVGSWAWPTVAVADDGDIVLSATISGRLLCNGNRDEDAFVVRLDPSGNVRWHRHLALPDSGEDAHAIAIADNGDLILSGLDRKTDCDTDPEPVFLRLSPGGDLLQRVNLPHVWQRPLDIGVGPEGDVYVAGSSEGIVAGVELYHEGFAMRLTPDFDVVWQTPLTIAEETDAGVFGFHPDGGIVVSGCARTTTGGTSDPLSGRNDLYTAHVDALGIIRWVRIAEDDPAAEECGYMATVSADGSKVWSLGAVSSAERYGMLVTRAPAQGGPLVIAAGAAATAHGKGHAVPRAAPVRLTDVCEPLGCR